MKFQRQAKILDLIDKHEIETQEELSEQLRNWDMTPPRRRYPVILRSFA